VILRDYECKKCEEVFEDFDGSEVACPKCKSAEVQRIFAKSPATLTVIIPTYPGCKKHKAGYVHSHGDRPKTPGKIQVGYTGK
jgi:DNA-directed RNA polymerase subunit RPC12/RpoP